MEALDSLVQLFGEPMVARVFSVICLVIFVARGSYGLYNRIARHATPEQTQLFNYLKELLSSSNGWFRDSPDSLLYQRDDVVVAGKVNRTPSVHVRWEGRKVFIKLGPAEYVQETLSSHQVKKLGKLARNVAAKLEEHNRSVRINALLTSLSKPNNA